MITILKETVTIGEVDRRQLEAVLAFLGSTTQRSREKAGLSSARAEMVGLFYQEAMEALGHYARDI